MRPASARRWKRRSARAFRQKAAGAKSPYDGGPTSARIVAALEQWAQSPAFGRPKTFYDAPCEEEKA